MKLLVQEFLETHTFKELEQQHGVYCSLSKSGHKWSLNYDQLEAKESDPLAQECRGLILSRKDGSVIPSPKDDVVPGETMILAYPMKRFFNHGQGAAAQIDWSDPKLSVLEKMDGTLCILYWDPWLPGDNNAETANKWCVATRSVPDADLLMDNGLFTFRTLFEKALRETTGYDLSMGFKYLVDRHHTYCFELTTPYNRIVVAYPDCRITLLSVRNLVTHGEMEFDHPVVERLIPRVPFVQAHTYTSIDDLLNWVSSLNPIEHEGVVVRDSQFNRIKVKNAAYVVYNKLHDRLGSSERNCMEFVLLEKDDDVAPFLAPEVGQNMAKLKEGLQRAIMKYDSVYQLILLNLKALGLEGNKKEFALLVTRHHDMWHAPFFIMFTGKASSMKDFIQKSRKNGTWNDGFLDKILEIAKNENP